MKPNDQKPGTRFITPDPMKVVPHTNNAWYRREPPQFLPDGSIELDGSLIADAALMAKAGEKRR